MMHSYVKHPELEDNSHEHGHDENGEHYDPDAITVDGMVTKTRVYHHDPHDSTQAYHIHYTWDVERSKYRYFYHFGSAEHKDEMPGHIDYWLNQVPVEPNSGFTPRASGIAEAHLPDHAYHKLEEHSPPAHSALPPAYAPLSPKLSENRHSHFSRNQSWPSAPQVDEKKHEESCCSCTIS